MPQGTVAWFAAEKGFGFLTPDDGSPDVFVHVSEVEGGQPLQEGEAVAYDVRQGDRGPQAVGVRSLGGGGGAAGGESAEGAGLGTVTWFAADKGFGFVAPDDGGPDVFVHVSAVEDGVALQEGDRVELEVRQGDRGPQGERVRLLDGAGAPVEEAVWMQGTVSWYSPDKGFGFLVPDDLFVHGSAVTGGGPLQDGQRVAFEVRMGERGPQAEQVRVLGQPAQRRRPEAAGAERRPEAATAGQRPEPVAAGRRTGQVARWDADRGFGFLSPDDGSDDVFVHVSALDPDDRAGLPEGERVAFEVVAGPRGPQAQDVRRAP